MALPYQRDSAGTIMALVLLEFARKMRNMQTWIPQAISTVGPGRKQAKIETTSTATGGVQLWGLSLVQAP